MTHYDRGRPRKLRSSLFRRRLRKECIKPSPDDQHKLIHSPGVCWAPTTWQPQMRKVATTLAEIPGEAIPFLGIPILLAATAYEITLACENLDDLDQLYSDMGMEDETPDNVMDSVCHPTMPNAGKVWKGVVDKSGDTLYSSHA